MDLAINHNCLIVLAGQGGTGEGEAHLFLAIKFTYVSLLA